MKKGYLVIGLCLMIVMLVLVSACGSPKSTTATATTTATSTKTATATQTATATKTPAQTATSTKTPALTPTSGGGEGGSLSDILGNVAKLTSLKYDMVITTTGTGTFEGTVWMKNQKKIREDMTIDGASTTIIFDMDENVMYTYMPDQNMAMKTALNPSMMPEGSTPDASDILQYDPKTLGTETIDGKSCTVITWDIPGTGSFKEWVWTDKGFPLKMETTAGGQTTVIEFKNIDFSDIPDSIFKLPDGVQIIETGT